MCNLEQQVTTKTFDAPFLSFLFITGETERKKIKSYIWKQIWPFFKRIMAELRVNMFYSNCLNLCVCIRLWLLAPECCLVHINIIIFLKASRLDILASPFQRTVLIYQKKNGLQSVRFIHEHHASLISDLLKLLSSLSHCTRWSGLNSTAGCGITCWPVRLYSEDPLMMDLWLKEKKSAYFIKEYDPGSGRINRNKPSV